jgi:quercetin 2,3-dioxygenase
MTQNNAIISLKPLGFMWPTVNPFLFCAHHLDNYPAGNGDMGPAESLAGRDMGQDFTPKDGWRMYHGRKVPGFPVHPHRGFETITIVRNGFVDHSDSHGQAGRYGMGDVQWMTAGSGLQHSEMFPLLNTTDKNPTELFQIWLNLPKAKKFAEPHFKMMWAEEIPIQKLIDDKGKLVEINVIAGMFHNLPSLPVAPDSWAADPANEVAVWAVKMQSDAQLNIPAASSGVNRTIYFHLGTSIQINGTTVESNKAITVNSNMELTITNGSSESQLLVLQGKPIEEPVVQYGPFVMNNQAEIQQAMADYRQTEFGGWPWPQHEMVHPRARGRFAKYRDGHEEIR